MTSEGVRAELREAAQVAARDAVVRRHHEMFRAAQRAVGCEPVAYDDLSERTRRLQHNQLDPQADAALDAVWAIVAPLLAERDALAEQVAQAERERDKAHDAWTVLHNSHQFRTEKLATTEAAVARAEQREARVRELHHRTSDRGFTGCHACAEAWPCPTITALDEGDTDDQS